MFIQKLREKRQTPEQQKQAAHALSLYFEILRKIDSKTPPSQINTEKTVKATSPSTPFIKGEFSNNLLRAEAAPRSSSQSADSGNLEQHRRPFRPHRRENIIMNGVVWRKPNLWNGTRLLTRWRRRSRHGIIPEKRSKLMRIGTANSRATCETNRLMNCRQRM